MQRPAVTAGRDVGFRRARLRARELGGARDERVQLRLKRLDAFKQRVGVLDGGQLARADEVGRFGDGEKVQFVSHVRKP